MVLPLEQAEDLANVVTLLGGKTKTVYDGWESIRIQRGIDQISGTFSISMIDKWRQSFENWPLVQGERINILIGLSTPVLTGFIDRLSVSITNDDRTIEISGRDVTGDLVDCSAQTTPSEFKLVTIAQLAAIFVTAPFAIPVVFDTDIGAPFEKFTVKQGESVFELMTRAAKLRGLLIQATETGTLLITNRASAASQIPALGRLVQGQNILDARASYDYTDRFTTYTVLGQAGATDVFNRKAVSQVVGVATDPFLTDVLPPRPNRPKTIIADGSIDFASAIKRANWEATTRAARAVEVSIKVQGWRQLPTATAPLWRPNLLVPVDMPFIGQQVGQMLITGVQFSKSISEGTTTTLRLTRPDAYIPNLPVVNPALDSSKNLGWKFELLKIVNP